MDSHCQGKELEVGALVEVGRAKGVWQSIGVWEAGRGGFQLCMPRRELMVDVGGSQGARQEIVEAC